MSLGAPAPSKGALRALRQLALGTSCTVAFTTGLLAEDRRRRIHAAREVQENGRLIKSSRNYHGAAGAVAVANFEDHVLSNSPYYPVADHDPPITSTTPWNKDTPTKSKRLVRPPPRRDTTESLPPPVAKEIGDVNDDFHLYPTTERYLTPIAVRKVGGRQIHQRGVATNMLEALEVDDSIEAIESAAGVFFESFQNGLHIGKTPAPPESQLSTRLVTACGQLFDACQKYNCVGTYVPVIQKVLSLGPIEEDHFNELRAPGVIAYLLETKTHIQGDDQDYRNALDAASSIYLAELTTKSPKSANPQMRELGILLCSKAMNIQRYQLVDAIYWRMSAILSDEIAPCVNHLILANHKLGYHKNVLRYYRRFYVLTEPPKSEFDEVVRAVLDSCLTKNALGPAEDVVRTSAEMARSCGFKIRVEWPMKVLGQHWRTTRDLTSTRTLFGRLEALVDCIDAPQALYSAIIQFCVEDGNDDQAHAYLDQHILANHGAASLRTCGHLALSKAMKEDWEGVENSFEAMKSRLNHRKATAEHAQIFAPIFKLYCKSHSVSESEQFVKKCMNEYGLVPNIYVSNIMVGKFAETKEMDSISKWLEAVRPIGLMPDSVTFNAMLSHYRDEWQIPFADLLQLCRKMESVDKKLLDQCTVPILREAAIRETKGDRFAFVRFSSQIRLLRPGQEECENSLDFWPSMRAAMAKGSPRKTLRIYQSALKRENIHIPPDMFALAMQAAIESDTDNCISTLIELVGDAQKRGVEISSGMAQLLMHQLEDRTLSDNDIHYILKKNTKLFEDYGLSIPMSVATKVASVFSQRKLNHDALVLWEYYAAHNGISRESVDLSSLTVLLRVHLGLEDPDGVQWIMDTLSQNRIMPNRGFMLILKTGIKSAKRRLRSHLCSDVDKRFHELLEDSLDCVRSLRAHHVVECREVGAKVLDIMSAAVADLKNPKAVDLANTEHELSPSSSKQQAAEMDATEQHSETSMPADDDAARVKRNIPPLVRKVVSVPQPDRSGSRQKKHDYTGIRLDELPYPESAPLSFIDNAFSPNYNYFQTDARQQKQDAKGVNFGGAGPIRKLVSNY